jgi:hypothetical protein
MQLQLAWCCSAFKPETQCADMHSTSVMTDGLSTVPATHPYLRVQHVHCLCCISQLEGGDHVLPVLNTARVTCMLPGPVKGRMHPRSMG